MSTTEREPRAPDGIRRGRRYRDMPLLPAASIAGRALVTVIAIMTFLAALMAGIAVLVTDASTGWRDQVTREVTIQVRPAAGRDLDADSAHATEIAKAHSSVADAEVYGADRSAQLLEPWLGVGLDLSQLPVPRLIVLKMAQGGSPDIDALRQNLVTALPNVSLDDHSVWLDRLSAMTNTLIGVAITLFALVVLAMALAVVFATRGAMAGNREIVDVLHFVGAEDSYIAREFQRHFFRLGLKGGLVGGFFAILAFAASSLLASFWSSSAGGEQLRILFGAFSLGWTGYATILLVAVSIALLTGTISRTIVFRRLRGLDAGT